MTQLDWLKPVSEHNLNDYRKGFYFAVIASAFVALTVIDVMIRLRDQFYKSISFIRVLMLASVIFFGTLCGVYSMTNTYFHINNYDNIKAWYNLDKQVGIFAL